MATIATGYVQIIPTTKGLGNNLKKTFTGLPASANSAGSMSATTFAKNFASVSASKMVSVGNTLWKGLGIGLTGAIAAAVPSAIKRIDTLNNFPKVMSNLGISASAASSAIKKIDEGLTGLPTTLDQGALAVQRFTSSSGNVKKSTKTFLAVNNAILAGGQSSEIQASALEQLSQAYAKGKPDMMEWRTIQTAMPAQLKQTALAMLGTEKSQNKLLVAAQKYSKAHPMSKAGDEIVEQLTKAKTSTGDFSVALGTALRNGIVPMSSFTNSIEKLNEKGVNGFKAFSKQAKNATGGISTTLQNLKTSFTRGVASIVQAIATPENLKALQNFFKTLESVMKKISPHIPTLLKVGGAIAGISLAMSAFSKIASVISTLKGLAGVVPKIAGLGVAGSASLGAGFKGIATGLSAFANPKILLGAGILAGSIAIIATGIGASIWIFDKLASSAITHLLQSLANGVKAFNDINGDNLKSVGLGLIGLGTGIAVLTAGNIISGISSFFGVKLEYIPNKLKPIVDWVGAIPAETIQKLKDFAPAIEQFGEGISKLSGLGLDGGVIKDTLIKVREGVENAVDKIDLFYPLADGISYLGIKLQNITGLKLNGHVLFDELNGISRGVEVSIPQIGYYKQIADGISYLGIKLRDVTGLDLNGFVIANTLQTITNKIQTLNNFNWNATALNWKSHGEYMGNSLSAGIARGVTAGINSAIYAVNRLIDRMNVAYETKLKIKSPSKVWAKYGEFMVLGLQKGLDNTKINYSKINDSFKYIDNIATAPIKAPNMDKIDELGMLHLPDTLKIIDGDGIVARVKPVINEKIIRNNINYGLA
jgi:tape measure domain-containing protein